ARMGRSSGLKVGEWVLAIGSPFGFDYSVTAGIVSAKGRSLPQENYIPFIQTDVAINPGNSGGPLFNMRGQVVGVNAQIYSASGGFMGLSFAVPIDVAMDVAEQLKTSGHVTRGWLGVLIQNVNQELAESFGMSKPMGALVAKVLPGGPGAEAGIEAGDIIVAYDGKDVVESAGLPPMVGRTKVGATVPIKVIRNGKPLVLRVKIGKLPDQARAVAPAAQDASVPAAELGLSVVALTPDQRQALDDKGYGVLVSKVDDGPARSAGIRPGDVIMMLNYVRIRDTDEFTRVIRGLARGKTVPVLVQRPNGPVFLAIKVPG
ncbi:MAG: PDZ domain-containing protein, partial [Gammaproteobacteria bacterium]